MVVCGSVGTFFSPEGGDVSITRSEKIKKKRNTAPHLPWYAALHEKKKKTLRIAFIMTCNARVMPDCDILIR